MSASATSRLGLIKPNPGTGEPVNVATQINASLDKIDAAIGAEPVLSTSLPPSPYHGKFVRATDTRRVFLWNATDGSWDEILTAPKNIVYNRAFATGAPVATATTAETVIISLPSKTYGPNMAYELTFRAQVQASAVLDLVPHFRKGTTATGQLLVDYGRIGIAVAGNDRFFEFSGTFSVGATAVTSQLCFAVSTNTGTCAFKGFNTGAVEMRANILGVAADFPGLPALV